MITSILAFLGKRRFGPGNASGVQRTSIPGIIIIRLRPLIII